MSNRMNPFSIDPSFELPSSRTLQETPTSFKDQRIWSKLLDSSIFKQMVNDIRRRRGIRVGIENELQERVFRLARSGRPYRRWSRMAIEYRHKPKPDDVVSVLRQFDLTPLWHEPITHYILNGETWFPPDTRTAQSIRCEDSFGRKRLLVEIYADTDRADFIRSWKDISFYQKQLPGYRTKWRRVDETGLRKQIVVLLRQDLRPAEVCRRLMRDLRPQEIRTQSGYDSWENRQAALRRLVYRVDRERRVTANVT